MSLRSDSFGTHRKKPVHLFFSAMRPSLVIALFGACSALHIPCHTTVGLRPLRFLAVRPWATAPPSALPRVSLEHRIAEEREALQRCQASEDCIVAEALMLRDQLSAFASAGHAKVRLCARSNCP